MICYSQCLFLKCMSTIAFILQLFFIDGSTVKYCTVMNIGNMNYITGNYEA